MSRPLAVLTVLALLLTSSGAAPVPKDKARLYNVSRVGDKRVYLEDGQSTYYSVVTKVEEGPDGVKLVTEELGSEKSQQHPHRVLAVSKDGVAIYSGVDGKKYDPPHVLLKLPAREGTRWEYKFPTGRITYTYTVRGVERVEVPAGVFEAVRVDAEGRGEGTNNYTTWYAPGIGEVKNTNTAGVGKGYVRVLESYDPGRD